MQQNCLHTECGNWMQLDAIGCNWQLLVLRHYARIEGRFRTWKSNQCVWNQVWSSAEILTLCSRTVEAKSSEASWSCHTSDTKPSRKGVNVCSKHPPCVAKKDRKLKFWSTNSFHLNMEDHGSKPKPVEAYLAVYQATQPLFVLDIDILLREAA